VISFCCGDCVDKSARKELKAAIDPFGRICRRAAPLNLSDDTPLHDVVPGAWPTLGALRRLVAVAEANDLARKR
jgi:hypothetical protein